jgi:hypothetical protein
MTGFPLILIAAWRPIILIAERKDPAEKEPASCQPIPRFKGKILLKISGGPVALGFALEQTRPVHFQVRHF